MRILLAGSSGMIGLALQKKLNSLGHQTIRLVRPTTQEPDPGFRSWDPDAGLLDPNHLADCDAVVFLGGENIAARAWTPLFKKRILESRIRGTSLISQTLARSTEGPKTFFCASAIGFYGDTGQRLVDETVGPGRGFLADVVDQWEKATQPAAQNGCRVVNGRIGIVLSPDGGALAKMLTPFKWGFGGRLGNGRQFMSWISLSDVVSAIIFCLEQPAITGPINLVGPNPVSNAEFTKTLARGLKRPALLPVPGPMISLLMGEMGRSLLLASTRVSSARLSASGFVFATPQLAQALSHVMP